MGRQQTVEAEEERLLMAEAAEGATVAWRTPVLVAAPNAVAFSAPAQDGMRGRPPDKQQGRVIVVFIIAEIRQLVDALAGGAVA